MFLENYIYTLLVSLLLDVMTNLFQIVNIDEKDRKFVQNNNCPKIIYCDTLNDLNDEDEILYVSILF